MNTKEKASLDRYLNKLNIERMEKQSFTFVEKRWINDAVLGRSKTYPNRLIFSQRFDATEKYSTDLYQKISKNCQRDPLIKEAFSRTSSQEKAIGQNNEFPGPIKIKQLLRKKAPMPWTCKKCKKEDGLLGHKCEKTSQKKNTKKRFKIYIASPYTIGDVAMNVRLQIDTVDQLINLGFVPFAPLYYHFQHLVHPRVYEDWMDQDLAWIEACDAVLRLPGQSSGADREVEYAASINKLVFYSVEDLIRKYIEPNYIRPAKRIRQ
jgi:hypothetical protein